MSTDVVLVVHFSQGEVDQTDGRWGYILTQFHVVFRFKVEESDMQVVGSV
jgi:hypothetical protein